MKYPLSTIFLLFSSIVIAQPVIPVSAIHDVGESEIIQYGVPDFAPGDSGENITWDFSDWQLAGESFVWEAIDPEETPFLDSFPTANAAFNPQSASSIVTEFYLYYEYDGGDVSYLGSVLISEFEGVIDTSYISLNEDAHLQFSFPINFGDSFDDEVKGFTITNIGGLPLFVEREGVTSTTADGYGTLITPFGTYENVLRVHITEDLEDEIIEGFPTMQHWDRYYWMSPDYNYVLMQMEQATVTPFGSPSMEQEPQVFFNDADISSNLKKIEYEIRLSIYPNPAQDVLLIRDLEQLDLTKWEIFSLDGKRVLGGTHLNSDGINIKQLANGSYILTAYNSERKFQTLFSKD